MSVRLRRSPLPVQASTPDRHTHANQRTKEHTVDDLSPADALRRIADHLEKHPTHGPLSIYLSMAGTDGADNLRCVLDGATAADVTICNPEQHFPNVRREFGPVDIVAIIDRKLVSEQRPTVVEQVLSTTELLARQNQQALLS